jgi:predicted nucleic acid-binding protein
MIIGLDTNILCYALDPAYPEHEKLKDLLFNLSTENRLALNPTIIQEKRLSRHILNPKICKTYRDADITPKVYAG